MLGDGKCPPKTNPPGDWLLPVRQSCVWRGDANPNTSTSSVPLPSLQSITDPTPQR